VGFESNIAAKEFFIETVPGSRGRQGKKGSKEDGASLIGRQNLNNSTLSGPVPVQQGKERRREKESERPCGKETKKGGCKVWKRMKRKLGQEEEEVVVRRCCGRRRRNERGEGGGGQTEREKERAGVEGGRNRFCSTRSLLPFFLSSSSTRGFP
jgi:hypothetical protein